MFDDDHNDKTDYYDKTYYRPCETEQVLIFEPIVQLALSVAYLTIFLVSSIVMVTTMIMIVAATKFLVIITQESQLVLAMPNPTRWG